MNQSARAGLYGAAERGSLEARKGERERARTISAAETKVVMRDLSAWCDTEAHS